ncbi:MAG: NAD-dependent protein deacetylase [Myxococcota bacterium]
MKRALPVSRQSSAPELPGVPPDENAARLIEFMRGRRVCVLTGAGTSTDSGIPDYRGSSTRHRKRNPVQFRPFVDDVRVRRRYWARAVIGWPRFRTVRPNPAHEALAQLEAAGVVDGLITQNVDRLHHKAGSSDPLELHGALAEVGCLDCHRLWCRDEVQAWMLALNPGFEDDGAESAPDGDAELPSELIERFEVAACPACGGVLKPRVVFFGENVPKPIVEEAWARWRRANALLVVGSSLTVFSGYRFVKKAPLQGLPVAILNLGPTRGDPLAELRLDAPVSQVLPKVAAALA